MTDETRKQNFLACLSDPSRFSLIAALAQGPLCVTELAGAVGLSQSCTTRHLQALLREGIVSSQRQGKRIVFDVRVQGPDAHPVLSWAFGAGRAVRAGAATSRARRKPGGSRAARDHADPAEVTDALIVGHDAAWTSDDSAPIASLRPPLPDDIESTERLSGPEFDPADPPPASDPSPPPEERRAIPRSASLDDFLL